MDYLVTYARARELDVRVGVEARRIEPDERSGWTVATSEDPRTARHVIVATGWDAEPKLPPAARRRAASRYAGERLLSAAAFGDAVMRSHAADRWPSFLPKPPS